MKKTYKQWQKQYEQLQNHIKNVKKTYEKSQKPYEKLQTIWKMTKIK